MNFDSQNEFDAISNSNDDKITTT